MLKNAYCDMFPVEEFKFCWYFWNYVLSPKARAKCTPHRYASHGTNGYTLPVFVPDYDEVNSGFSFLNSDTNRKSGNNQAWWLSRPTYHSNILKYYCVNPSGTISEYAYTASNLCGFRPFVAINLS